MRLRFAGLPMSSLKDLMQCQDGGSVARFVHKCMERVRQQSDWLIRGQQCNSEKPEEVKEGAGSGPLTVRGHLTVLLQALIDIPLAERSPKARECFC
jgi:hypothetical protein